MQLDRLRFLHRGHLVSSHCVAHVDSFEAFSLTFPGMNNRDNVLAMILYTGEILLPDGAHF